MKRGDGSKGTVTECWVQWHTMTRRGSEGVRVARVPGEGSSGGGREEGAREGGRGGGGSEVDVVRGRAALCRQVC